MQAFARHSKTKLEPLLTIRVYRGIPNSRKQAAPSESNGERRGVTMMLAKLTKLLIAAALLLSQLAILAALAYALLGR